MGVAKPHALGFPVRAGYPASMHSGTWRAPTAPGPVRATVRLPGSKSITNRALVLAALSSSPSLIRDPLRARDTSLAIAALRTLGCEIHDDDKTTVSISPGSVAPGSAVSVDVGNAGTVMRFLPAVAALTPLVVSFDGDSRARERPVGPILEALRSLGADVDGSAVPFTIRGTGRVAGGRVTLDASGSSQFVSGLLLAAARFDDGVEVRHSGPAVPSLPHIEMTLRMLRMAGVSASAIESGDRPVAWRVAPGPVSLGSFTVEPDLSNAGPFLAAALVTGGEVTLPGWPAESLQAASSILGVFEAMGASCTVSSSGLVVRGSGSIRGIEADLRDIPELGLPVAAVAALASSPSRLTGIGHLRVQETDRLAAIAKEINALGGDVTELPDGVLVRPRPLTADGQPFGTYDDHRMVMAAAVLGLAVPGLSVANAATVGKTFPSFMDVWSSMVSGV
jgi:3-phosphoshikimate 1-carboxyvinyltransferase